MQKYVAPTPQTEVIGQTLLSMQGSVNYEDFQAILGKYGLVNIQPDTWYPGQVLLDFHKTLASNPNGSENLVSIGIKIIEHAIMPPDVNSVPSALNMLNAMIAMNMRNYGDEHYEVRQVGPTQYLVFDYTAISHDLNYGFLYGILRRFAPTSTKRVLKRTYLNPANPDADGARYEIEW